MLPDPPRCRPLPAEHPHLDAGQSTSRRTSVGMRDARPSASHDEALTTQNDRVRRSLQRWSNGEEMTWHVGASSLPVAPELEASRRDDASEISAQAPRTTGRPVSALRYTRRELVACRTGQVLWVHRRAGACEALLPCTMIEARMGSRAKRRIVAARPCRVRRRRESRVPCRGAQRTQADAQPQRAHVGRPPRKGAWWSGSERGGDILRGGGAAGEA
jgi:hypothetical protein